MTHKFSRTLILAACTAAISMLPLAADPLSDYLTSVGGGDYVSNGTTFTDGDKTIKFNSYSLSVTCFDTVLATDITCPTGSFAPTTPGGLNVVGSDTVSVTGAGLYGFTLQGLVQAKSFMNGADQVDVTEDIGLTYTVTASAGLISDLHLGVGGASVTGTTTNPPAILITESTNDPGAGSLSVTDPPPTFTAQLNLPSPYVSSLVVTKDISLESGAGTNDQASFSVLEQSFSQVPEPRAYAAVLGLFCAAFFVIKRRRQQTA